MFKRIFFAALAFAFLGTAAHAAISQNVGVCDVSYPTKCSPNAGLTPSSAIVANNTTSVAIKATPGIVYSVRVFNNSATIAYLKFYDATQANTTCGSGTPKLRIMIPANTSGAGAVIVLGGGYGTKFLTAISRCVTTGIADNDTTSPAASTYIVEADYN